jgi:hypothetical protein
MKSKDIYNEAGESISLNEVMVGEDSRSLQLTHYALAERLMQVEYAKIAKEMITTEDNTSDTLIYLLEGGFRGFHNMSPGELWSEWKDSEELWYKMYDTGTLPWEIYDEDPIKALEEDENGEVETYGKRLTDAEVQDA